MNTDFYELTTKEQNSDYNQADKVLRVIIE